MVLKITNLHILRHLPTHWLYLLERYTIDNQRRTHTASVNDKQLKTSYNKYQQAVKALILSAFYCIYSFHFSWISVEIQWG